MAWHSHHIIDCATGKVLVVPLTEREIAECEARVRDAQERHAAQEAEAEQRAEDEKLILERAQDDPVFAALARRLKIT
jgi:hypothetical protein